MLWLSLVVLTATPAPHAFAKLPAQTFADGPTSGAHIQGGPFSAQPVQGFSGLIAEPDGGFLTVVDNGYGTVENSSDFLLRVYALRVDFTKHSIEPSVRFTLNDAEHHVDFPLVRGTTDRLLTGADFDVESFVRAPDGTFWFGDETGPFLLHTDAHGTLLEAPVSLVAEPDAGVWISTDHPLLPSNAMLRQLESLRTEALTHGAKTPYFSPHETMLTTAGQVTQLHTAGFRVVPWTVNDAGRIAELGQWRVDGVISDRPDLARAVLDAGVEVQGHRGARGLAPEATLPAFEAGLRAGVDTLELDVTRTRDGAVLWHDGEFPTDKCRGTGSRVLAELTTAQAQRFVCDGRLPKFPEQSLTVSARVKAFSKNKPFAPLTLAQLFHFAAATPTVRFNIETKVRAPDDAQALTRLIVAASRDAGVESRVTLQSFEWNSLRTAFTEFPNVQTVALLEEPKSAPSLPTPRIARSSGFENLALTPDGKSLIAMLEKPLPGSKELLAFSYSLARHEFEGVAFRFPLHERATAVGDLTLLGDGTGYALERDDTDGKPVGYKRLVRFRLPKERGGVVTRSDAADLHALGFTFFCIEGVAALPNGDVAIVNDNNFPFGHARSAEAPDGTELIVVRPTTP